MKNEAFTFLDFLTAVAKGLATFISMGMVYLFLRLTFGT